MSIKAILFTIFLLPSALVSADHPVLKLNDRTWQTKTEGKSIFIKFFSPFCELCQELAPEFAKLAEEWEGHNNGVIVEMDCESEDSLKTCYHDPFNVEEYPTLWYGDPYNPKRYLGDWTYESMSAWAIEHIGIPPCSVKNIEFCNDYEKQVIDELQSKSKSELEHVKRQMNKQLSRAHAEHDDFIAEVNNIYRDANDDKQLKSHKAAYEEVMAELNTIYEELQKDFQNKLDTIRSESNHMWMLQILQGKSGERRAREF